MKCKNSNMVTCLEEKDRLKITYIFNIFMGSAGTYVFYFSHFTN